jgi:hypothetical protein
MLNFIWPVAPTLARPFRDGTPHPAAILRRSRADRRAFGILSPQEPNAGRQLVVKH